MGQSVAAAGPGRKIGGDRCVPATELQLSIFLTDFGWFGLLGREEKISRLVIGHTSSDGVREAMAGHLESVADGAATDMIESDWLPDVRRRLEQYASGRPVDFSDCCLESIPRTEFQQRVLQVTRSIPYGETISYGELAEKANAPRAARAVGSVMASNRVPIIIPCHRVIAAGAKLGGFSAPSGVRLKEQMLMMEAGGDWVGVDE
jgi:methylated-DNA-[protein]-cysteine S-methyltransferase